MDAAGAAALRGEVEAFLYDEAELLDTWRLDAWAELFTEDAIYRIPALDNPSRDPDNSLFLVNDDLPRLQSRVRQLLGDTAWAENPRSMTRRLITNVRVTAADDAHLSAAHERDTAYIAVHQYRGMEWRPYFEAVEAIMDDYAGRPHWGKRHFQTAETLAPRYPRWDAFQAARDLLDPERVFTNEYAERVLGP